MRTHNASGSYVEFAVAINSTPPSGAASPKVHAPAAEGKPAGRAAPRPPWPPLPAKGAAAGATPAARVPQATGQLLPKAATEPATSMLAQPVSTAVRGTDSAEKPPAARPRRTPAAPQNAPAGTSMTLAAQALGIEPGFFPSVPRSADAGVEDPPQPVSRSLPGVSALSGNLPSAVSSATGTSPPAGRGAAPASAPPNSLPAPPPPGDPLNTTAAAPPADVRASVTPTTPAPAPAGADNPSTSASVASAPSGVDAAPRGAELTLAAELTMLQATAPAQVTSATAHAATPAQEGLTTTVGSSGWAEALGARVVWMAHQGVTAASLRLEPEHLGPLEIKISLHQGAASVWFGASEPQTRSALEQALPQLQQMFASHGLLLSDAGVSREPPRESAPAPQPATPTLAAESQENATEVSLALPRSGLLDTYA